MALAVVKGIIPPILVAFVGLVGHAQAADAAWDTAKIEQLTAVRRFEGCALRGVPPA